MSAQSVSDSYFEPQTSSNSAVSAVQIQFKHPVLNGLSERSDKRNSVLRKHKKTIYTAYIYIYYYIYIFIYTVCVCVQCALNPLRLTGVEFAQPRASFENNWLGETLWQCYSWKRSIKVKTHSFLKRGTNSSEERYLVSTPAQFTLVPTFLSLSIPFATSSCT